MSHFAEIDENNLVLRVVVGDNNDPANDEGYQWLVDNLGGTWIKTSYNNKIRGIYAAVGFTYDKDEDIFITPQPYASWTREGSIWKAPIEYPSDDLFAFTWDEELGNWVEVLAE